MESHIEIIKCPECNRIQQAIVEHSIPFYSYVHHCVKCNYTIMESEWIKMPEPIHVYPLNDLRDHYLESNHARLDGFSNDVPPYCPCLCNPKPEKHKGVWLIIHNSFDGREGLEWVDNVLNNVE